MIDVSAKKDRILSFLDSNGPSLPVRIAKEIDMSPVFASAILSELLQVKKVRLSNLKVGSSPLYLLPGQEVKLELFVDHLKGVEKEAFNKLREDGEIEDGLEEPAMRIALRSIKDFAVPVKRDGKLVWRYAFQKNVEKKKSVQESSSVKKAVVEQSKEIMSKKPKPKEDSVVVTKSVAEDIFEKGAGANDSFEDLVVSFVESKGFSFVEKIQSDKREFIAKVNLKTAVGDVNFLLIAKNKKTTSKDEISSALQRAEYEKMPCLYVVCKDPPRSVRLFAEEYSNLFKILVFQVP